MTIRRLIKSDNPATKFTISESEGILVFETNEGPECLYMADPQETDLLKLSRFKNLSNIRYIGGEGVFNKLQQGVTHLPSPSRIIFLDAPKEVVFYAQTGKIRFLKQAERELNRKKNVLIVDDSKTIQKLLTKIISSSNILQVKAVASCPSEAREIIERDEGIDLVTLDIHMPEMNGVEFLKSFLGQKNIPTIMISSVSLHEGPLVMEALSSGAYTYIQKPSIDQLSEVSQDILEKLELVSKIGKKKKNVVGNRSNINFNNYEGLIAIGSSTGGTQALQDIFTTLPASIPPIVVVQHIPAVFSKALADRLNTLCPFTVKEACDGEILQGNTIYIAPGGRQMRLLKQGAQKRVSIVDDPPLNRFRPSVDYLFNSIATLGEKKLMGVILTGMGKDGANGLLKLKNSGAFTIAQDEESSVVFGMPKEAIALGAVNRVVSLGEMSATMVFEFNNLAKNKAA